jgi:hypothetical protein
MLVIYDIGNLEVALRLCRSLRVVKVRLALAPASSTLTMLASPEDRRAIKNSRGKWRCRMAGDITREINAAPFPGVTGVSHFAQEHEPAYCVNWISINYFYETRPMITNSLWRTSANVLYAMCFKRTSYLALVAGFSDSNQQYCKFHKVCRHLTLTRWSCFCMMCLAFDGLETSYGRSLSLYYVNRQRVDRKSHLISGRQCVTQAGQMKLWLNRRPKQMLRPKQMPRHKL